MSPSVTIPISLFSCNTTATLALELSITFITSLMLELIVTNVSLYLIINYPNEIKFILLFDTL